MDWIYPVSYLFSLSGLVLWFVVRGNKRLSRTMSALFLTAFFVYLASLSFSSGTTAYKLMILVRDMVVMGLVSQLFNVFRSNKLLSVFMAIVAGGIVYFSYFSTLDLSFPQFPTAELAERGEFLIEVKSSRTDILEEMQKKYQCTTERAFAPIDGNNTTLDEYFLVDFAKPDKRKLKRFYDEYAGSGAVEWIEPNEVMTLIEPTAETVAQSGMKYFANDPGINQQWGFDQLDADRLHQALVSNGVKPRKTARVVVLDTGIDAAHEDLQANYRSISADYDTDPNGHGTHCAGIIGAVSNNGIGIASLAPGTGFVTVSSVRVLSALGAGTQESIIDGILRAADSGADVISMSLGGPSTQSKQKGYVDAVKYANAKGAIVVVSAGNNNRNAKLNAPANVEGVITVSAIDAANAKASFSNTVEDVSLGIAAPGVNIYSTLPANRYGNMSGTSMAAPYVSGLVGLMRAFQPDITTKEVYEILSSTGTTTKAGKKTGPFIQPYQAIEKVLD